MKRTDLDKLSRCLAVAEGANIGMDTPDVIAMVWGGDLRGAIAEIQALRKVAELGSKVVFDDYHSYDADNIAFKTALEYYQHQFTDEET